MGKFSTNRTFTLAETICLELERGEKKKGGKSESSPNTSAPNGRKKKGKERDTLLFARGRQPWIRGGKLSEKIVRGGGEGRIRKRNSAYGTRARQLIVGKEKDSSRRLKRDRSAHGKERLSRRRSTFGWEERREKTIEKEWGNSVKKLLTSRGAEGNGPD